MIHIAIIQTPSVGVLIDERNHYLDRLEHGGEDALRQAFTPHGVGLPPSPALGPPCRRGGAQVAKPLLVIE